MKIMCSIFKRSRRTFASLLLMIGLSQPVAAFDFDIDEDGQAQPLTDGLLMIRHLFGFSGTALINGAVAAGAERREAAEIESYLTENSAALDIDGDGKALPLTDGLLIIRYLFGFSGDALVQGAIAADAKIKQATEVEAQLFAVKSGSGGNNAAIDLDGDGIANAEDPDDDGDGVLDDNDAFPLIALDGLLDTDGDGRPDACDVVCTALGMTVDLDRDNDGVLDVNDWYPLIALGSLTDTDGDGRPNACTAACLALGMGADLDDDGDGVVDAMDAYALISIGGLTDTDGDGRPDVCDTACQATGMAVDFDADNDGRLDTLGPIVSSFNAHAIALSDHVDGRAKPTFYSLNPIAEEGVLKIDLGNAAIDLGPIQAILEGESQGAGVDSARVAFLLDRVPASGRTGSLKITIALIDGEDAVFGAEVNERLFKTTFEVDWSSDGALVSFVAPVQDQVVETSLGSGPFWVSANRTFEDVQPTIIEARIPAEYPGYPLLLEFDLLALFGEGLIEKLKEAGLFDTVTAWFNDVSDYYLVVDLVENSGSGEDFLGYQGQSFDRIQGGIKIQEVGLGVNDGFDLSVQAADADRAQSGFTLSINSALVGSEGLSQGLFAVLCGETLCFEPLPGGYLSREGLIDQVGLSPAGPAATLVAGLSRLPAANENLTYRVTWTEGEDGVRAEDEAMITMAVPMTFEPNDSAGVFTASTGAASILRTDGVNCAGAGACEVSQLDLQTAPVSSARPAGGAARALEFDLLPITTRVTGTDGYFDGFFKAGPYHVKVELTGRTGLLSYERQTITGIEGRFQVR
ncbi:thrombospondin type 3 repeat-containing protein [Pseudomonadales bacterium]|nr:thrombospondin type 3 repeat-containing protein [Pseudomonadales bacterium]